uniref:Uncharacterized protein n=1 Tax=Physcomitrium patens TaxID=3218 RepID=A0A7I4DH12_PHYPA
MLRDLVKNTHKHRDVCVYMYIYIYIYMYINGYVHLTFIHLISEREQEEIQKARNLLIAQQLPPPYYAGAQYYSRMDGASTSVDPTGNFPSTGGSFMTPQLPFYQPQAQSSVQNWLGNQITRPMERPSEAAETSVHLRGNSSRSQHTQSELPPRSTQFTQSEPTPRSTQFTRSEPQSNWLQATQHSDSDVDGLEYIN